MMAHGEGFIFSVLLLAGFVLMALMGLVMIATGSADVKMLLEFYVGLGALASMFGIPAAVKTWLETRGQTSQ